MFRPRPELNSIFLSDELIHASSHTSSLGVLFNERFSFNKHISATCKVAYYHLRNIGHTKETPGSFLPLFSMARLQHVQNAAARLIFKTQRSDRITQFCFLFTGCPSKPE